MKFILVLTAVLTAISVSAFETQKIQTPRGTEVNLMMHIPQGSKLPVLVVAPGQGCFGPLFETLGNKGFEKNYAVFRFEWSYCGSANAKPSAGLKDEVEDMLTVLAFAEKHAAVDASQIVIAGKSMGSGVAYRVFARHPELKALVLLTPICSYTTDENDNPLPQPVSVCDQNYPGLKEDPRPILMSMGSKDDACVLPVLFDYLKDSKGNVQTFVAGGDHGYRIFDNQGQLDSIKTQNNIDTVAAVVFNWMDLN